uniref:Uncharacterized protein n=1 Tax=Ciona savignyi TaxID=51511 RepID=H2ZDK6_CIOSA
MGRARRKHNAGPQIEVGTENVAKSTIKVNANLNLKGIDESNALILPDKSDTKVKKEQIKPLPRKLSKKQRKNYEKILDQKRKKE